MMMRNIPGILVVFMASLAYSSDKIGSAFFGLDYLPDNEYNETSSGVYRLQRSGFNVGFYFPLNFHFVEAHYKVGATTHQIEKRGWDWTGLIQKDESALYDKHASFINEILIGKEVQAMGDFTVLPQLGLGFQLDALNQDGDSPIGGIVYSDLYADFSARFRHGLKYFGVEMIVNYQYSLIPSWSGYEATDRIAASLGIYK
jgi:hypothetical protein